MDNIQPLDYSTFNQAPGENPEETDMQDLKKRIILVETISANHMYEKYIYYYFIKLLSKKFENSNVIFEQYKKAKVITELDVMIMLYSLLVLDLKFGIPLFLKSVLENPTLSKPSFTKLLKLVDKLDDGLLEDIMG